MSDALKPQLHGRDHRPGGRDPIPGLDAGSGLPTAYMVKTTNQTITSGGTGQTVTNWDGAGGSSGYATFFTPDTTNGFIDVVTSGVFIAQGWMTYTTGGFDYAFVVSPTANVAALGRNVPGYWLDTVFPAAPTGASPVALGLFLNVAAGTGGGFTLSVRQGTGSNKTLDTAQLWVTRLGDVVT